TLMLMLAGCGIAAGPTLQPTVGAQDSDFGFRFKFGLCTTDTLDTFADVTCLAFFGPAEA
ncbi:MAG TPA: hypothetical protein VIH21_10515, partial [Dehalococcoidia bacterium]